MGRELVWRRTRSHKRIGPNSSSRPSLKSSRAPIGPRRDVVAEPLERGFGLTLGNALRRGAAVLACRAAITSVQIDNVLHEFSSVPGVREDVTDIVLNLRA